MAAVAAKESTVVFDEAANTKLELALAIAIIRRLYARGEISESVYNAIQRDYKMGKVRVNV